MLNELSKLMLSMGPANAVLLALISLQGVVIGILYRSWRSDRQRSHDVHKAYTDALSSLTGAIDSISATLNDTSMTMTQMTQTITAVSDRLIKVQNKLAELSGRLSGTR